MSSESFKLGCAAPYAIIVPVAKTVMIKMAFIGLALWKEIENVALFEPLSTLILTEKPSIC